MMIGLFVVGGAIFQTGLAKMISSKILKLAGKNETVLFLLVMLVTGGIGAFVSNTGTVALMLPIVVSLAYNAGMSPSRLLMPLAFASSMGGMMTLIGTPPNLIIQDTLTSAGYEPLSFFSFLPVGLICLVTGILVLMPLSKIFLSKKTGKNDRVTSGKTLNQLVSEYSLSDNLYRLRIREKSPAAGKTVVDLDLRREYKVNVLEIRRKETAQQRFLKTVNQELASPKTVMYAGDVLYVRGEAESINRLSKDFNMEILDDHTSEIASSPGRTLAFYDIGIAEIVLMPSSNMVNQSIRDAGFREKFNVNILGIRRKKEYILHDLGEVKVHSGDVLLVQGTWQDIARLSKEDTEWVVLGQPRRSHHDSHGGDDGIRLHPCSSRHGCDDSRDTDGTYRLFQERGSRLQDHKLGDHRTVRGHAPDVSRSGENRSFRPHIRSSCERTWGLWSCRPAGRNIFHSISDDHVHQQHRDCSAHGSHRPAECDADRSESGAFPFRRDRGGEHVLCFPVLYPAQRPCDACRPIHLHGLCKSRTASSDHHGHSDDHRAAAALPVLIGRSSRLFSVKFEDFKSPDIGILDSEPACSVSRHSRP